MRLLSSIDWPLFFERVSLVEQILRNDPAGAYGRMDFPTRDRYRHSVEELAKNAKRPELDVARRAVDARRGRRMRDDAAARPPSSRRLLPDLARTLRSSSATRLPPDASANGWPGSCSGTRRSATSALIAVMIAVARRQPAGVRAAAGRARGSSSGWSLIVSLLPVSELAISLLNLIVTAQVPPRQLPKLDMRDGIPAGDRTMVVVPAIVDSEARLAVAARRARGALPWRTGTRTCISRC